MKTFRTLSAVKAGDQVAVISPSAGLPGIFPWVYELGLERLRTELHLTPKEYSTTRQMNAPLKNRAHDIMTAFADPANKAVFTSIGGDDQIRLIKLLDPQVFRDNPKPFFGFSDNTHLHNFLWNLGVPSFYGGAVMTQLAMQGGMHDFTLASIKQALAGGEVEIAAAETYNDEGLDWSDPDNLNKTRKLEPNDGWYWDGAQDAAGILWGGCVESLIVQCTADKFLPKAEDLKGAILFIETSEDIPDHWVVEYLLTGFGERGWLEKFRAVLVGRPKAWERNKQLTTEQKIAYRREQRETILKTVRAYNQTIPVVQNLDFGHTDPQLTLPMGGQARLDSAKQRIFLNYPVAKPNTP